MKNLIYNSSSLKGNCETVESILSTLLRSNQFNNSYILNGSPGIGKKSWAVFIAKVLFSINKTDIVDINSDISQQINDGSYSDFKLLSKTSKKNITVDDIRELSEFTAMQSKYNNKYKIVVIDHIESFNSFAANALIKIIEEPVFSTVFFLISSDISAVLSTIQSRSNTIHFNDLNLEDTNRVLNLNGIASIEESSIFAGTPGQIIEDNTSENPVIPRMMEFISNIQNFNNADIILYLQKLSLNKIQASQLHSVFKILQYHIFLMYQNYPEHRVEVVNKYCNNIKERIYAYNMPIEACIIDICLDIKALQR